MGSNSALAAARQEMERIGRELEREKQAKRPVPEKTVLSQARAAIAAEPVAVAPSTRSNGSKTKGLFSSDSSSEGDLEAELRMELDQVLGDDDNDMLFGLFEEHKMTPLQQAVETLEKWTDGEDTAKALAALVSLRAESTDHLRAHAANLEPTLARLRQSKDRGVAQAARSARLRIFSATKSGKQRPYVDDQLADARRELAASAKAQRLLRRAYNDAKHAWQRERADLSEQLTKAEKKAKDAVQRSQRTLEAARADIVRLEREISRLKAQIRSIKSSSPATSVTVQQRLPSDGLATAKRSRPLVSTASLPNCSRMVKSRTSDVSPTRSASALL